MKSLLNLSAEMNTGNKEAADVALNRAMQAAHIIMSKSTDEITGFSYYLSCNQAPIERILGFWEVK